MICYRDKTFCDATDCANFGPCPRSLTQAVKELAERHNLPVAKYSAPQELPCYLPKTALMAAGESEYEHKKGKG